jgi:hypothetical protein
VRRLAGLAVLALLGGCAGSASGGWSKPGGSEQQLGRDTADCLSAAQTLVGGGTQGPRTVVQQDRYRRCMENRGYTETPRK